MAARFEGVAAAFATAEPATTRAAVDAGGTEESRSDLRGIVVAEGASAVAREVVLW